MNKEIALEVDLKYVELGMNVFGEHEFESNMMCPICGEVAGDYEYPDLWYKYCPNCGQKLKYTEKE